MNPNIQALFSFSAIFEAFTAPPVSAGYGVDVLCGPLSSGAVCDGTAEGEEVAPPT